MVAVGQTLVCLLRLMDKLKFVLRNHTIYQRALLPTSYFLLTPYNMRVLIAEDDYLVIVMIKGILDEIGYTVVGEAADGLEAIKLTCDLKPDIVMLDLKMPDMDGIEAAKRISENCPTPMVMLTAYESQQLVKQASQAGVGAYLVKPPNATEIERAITVAVARFADMVELRRLNQELHSFAKLVGHSLKHPLSIILSYTELLVDDDQLPLAKQQEYLRLVHQVGYKMNSVINELQLLSGVRQADIIPLPLDMSAIVNQALQNLTMLIKEHQAQISLPDSWPLALGYAPWVEEVWVNYLSNAIKYGGRPPQIEVGTNPTSLDDSLVRFWVRDNGAGLSPEQQAKLFTSYTRLDQVELAGHGLGLSIVKQIMDKLHGQVAVISTVGQGSQFIFTLPKA